LATSLCSDSYAAAKRSRRLELLVCGDLFKGRGGYDRVGSLYVSVPKVQARTIAERFFARRVTQIV